MITIYALVVCIGAHCQPSPTLYHVEKACQKDAEFLNSVGTTASRCEPRTLVGLEAAQ